MSQNTDVQKAALWQIKEYTLLESGPRVAGYVYRKSGVIRCKVLRMGGITGKSSVLVRKA